MDAEFIAKRVLENIKRSGEFDNFRHDIFEKLAASREMDECLTKGQKIVRDVLSSAGDRDNLDSIRERLKERIRHSKLADILTRRIDPILTTDDQKFNDCIEKAVKAEMGEQIYEPPVHFVPSDLSMEPLIMEPVDMEVSSGASPSSQSSTIMDSQSSSHSESHANLRHLIADKRKNYDVIPEEQRQEFIVDENYLMNDDLLNIPLPP